MKKNIAVVTGGYSGESVISLQSADQVIKYLSSDKFVCYKVIIDRMGWVLSANGVGVPIDKNDFSATLDGKKINFDCVFMALHGTPGEDGKLQGYFDLIGLPYTSSGVAQSALTFSKSLTIATLKSYGLNTAKSMVVAQNEKLTAKDILAKVSLPCFVKPNEGGSSLGTTKVLKSEDLIPAIEKGFKEGSDVIVEEFIEGSEITCGVIRYKGEVKSLAITEIVCKNDFFDFHAKYQDKATEEITPARIPIELEKECKRLSEFIYKILGCKGMIRVDYIIKEGKLFLLEVNSIPGMTERSLLPQQAEYVGISKRELYENAIYEVLQ